MGLETVIKLYGFIKDFLDKELVVGKEDFCKWIDRLKQSKQQQTKFPSYYGTNNWQSKLYEDIQKIGEGENNQLKVLGKRQGFVGSSENPTEDTKKIADIREQYIKKLIINKQIDYGFVYAIAKQSEEELTTVTSTTSSFYKLVIVDEAQDFTLDQLRMICTTLKSPHTSYFFLHDQLQNTESTFNVTKDNIHSLSLENDLQKIQIELKGTYRVSQKVMELANIFLDTSASLGFKMYKGETKIKTNSPITGYVLQNTPEGQEVRLIQSAGDTIIGNTAVVAYSKKYEKAAAKLFPELLLFTPNTIKGLEFEHIILYGFFASIPEISTVSTSKLGKQQKAGNPAKSKTIDNDNLQQAQPFFTNAHITITRAKEGILFVDTEVWSIQSSISSSHQKTSVREKLLDEVSALCGSPSETDIISESDLTTMVNLLNTLEEWDKQLKVIRSILNLIEGSQEAQKSSEDHSRTVEETYAISEIHKILKNHKSTEEYKEFQHSKILNLGAKGESIESSLDPLCVINKANRIKSKYEMVFECKTQGALIELIAKTKVGTLQMVAPDGYNMLWHLVGKDKELQTQKNDKDLPGIFYNSTKKGREYFTRWITSSDDFQKLGKALFYKKVESNSSAFALLVELGQDYMSNAFLDQLLSRLGIANRKLAANEGDALRSLLSSEDILGILDKVTKPNLNLRKLMIHAIIHDDGPLVNAILFTRKLNYNDFVLPNGQGNLLHHVACHGRPKALTSLLHYNIDINSLENGDTALHVAVLMSSPRQLKQVEVRLSDNIANNRNYSSYSGVSKKCQIELLEVIKSHLLNVSSSHNDYTSVIDILLKYNANPNILDSKGYTPLYLAIIDANDKALAVLLRYNAKTDIKGPDGNTPLNYAIVQGHNNLIELLLRHNANPNILGTDGNTPLHMAANRGYDKVVESLLRHNADPNIPDTKGFTPLHTASIVGYDKVVESLLRHNADPNILGAKGFTPLHMAANQGYDKVVGSLLRHNAKTDIKDAYGNTPLDYAFGTGNDKVIELLLRHNANPNILDTDSNTPLDIATIAGHDKVVEVLPKLNTTEELEQSSGTAHQGYKGLSDLSDTNSRAGDHYVVGLSGTEDAFDINSIDAP